MIHNFIRSQRRHRGSAILSAIVVIVALTVSNVAAPAPAYAASAGSVKATWQDAKGRTITLRHGNWSAKTNTGFGWAKVVGKHGIASTATLKFITRNPDGGKAEGTSRVYTAYANKTVCSNGKCRLLESRQVKLVHHNGYVNIYYGASVKGTLGVQTAYCVNPDRSAKCPPWVDRALNGRALSSASETVEWSYAPRR
ncbi:hypothetical protein M3147_11810 [Agromyces mediolanus]|uniref:hypothetical protein n=1 Tax=Agromyces mediolanus TaxID=41986 RepID=UPI0020422105|nr:hypothetical protein [Agromyces mediolanus]MCM3657937.1 hypothetical protein [Agromyces mediolanus]